MFETGTLVNLRMEDGIIPAIYLEQFSENVSVVMVDDGSEEGFIFDVETKRVEK